MKVRGKDSNGDHVVVMSQADLIRLICALDAAERNYRGVPHGISDMAAGSMCNHIAALRSELEKCQ